MGEWRKLEGRKINTKKSYGMHRLIYIDGRNKREENELVL